ncbi:MAG: helix-turn-helix transcriptional regulator [Ruminococcaceae bacterium]|nr:helix-turn-helix transcriptional regulator [Oscillospiraceae bacterium]
MKNILAVILRYREERGWTEYQLAERADLPQSTISSWYRRNIVPSVSSLEKVCTAFGITLSQLFAEGENGADSQQRLIAQWARLSKEQQEAVLTLIDKM